MLEDLGRLRKSFEDMDGFEFSRVVCLFVVIILYSAACGYDIHIPINPFRSNENIK